LKEEEDREARIRDVSSYLCDVSLQASRWGCTNQGGVLEEEGGFADRWSRRGETARRRQCAAGEDSRFVQTLTFPSLFPAQMDGYTPLRSLVSPECNSLALVSPTRASALMWHPLRRPIAPRQRQPKNFIFGTHFVFQIHFVYIILILCTLSQS
jgi:hypothetical protein